MAAALRLLSAAFVLTTAFAFSPRASAECASFALVVWPDEGTLPVNGQIVLTGYGEAQALLRTIAKKKPRLVSEGDAIALAAEQLHEGEFELMQAVLTPERRLALGKTYRLVIDGVPRDELSTYVDGGFVPITYRATAEDTTAAQWNEAPALLGTESIPYGCGPSREAKVRFSVSEPVMFLVELEYLATRAVRRFLIEPRKGTLYIGHGMCGGAFIPRAKQHYRARLVAVDAAGHSTPAPGAPLEFVGPELSER